MSSPWLICSCGILFCIAGVFHFHRHAFEENKTMTGPVLLMIAGVVLIGAGMAKYFGLIH